MSLRPFFFPKHVALIGASKEKHKVGHALAEHLRSFSGRVSYVNRKGYFLYGKKCVPNIKNIVHPVDLAVIATPAATVPSILLDCASCKIKSVIIISAGFGESGEKKLQEEIRKIITKYNIRVIGPNCFGVVSTPNKLDLTYAKLFPPPGNIGFIAQSGALWSGVVERALVQRIGFSTYISLGNMIDVDFIESLKYLDADKHTKVIVCYIETLRERGRAFMATVAKMKKPVVVLKGGISLAGARASLSHTGSLTGNGAVYRAAMRQCGAYVSSTITETFDLAQFLCLQPKLKGKRVVIVTNGGGPSIICADLLEKYGLDVVALPKGLHFSKLPKDWSHNNPIDIVGDAPPERFRYALSVIAKKKFYDAVIVLYAPQQMGDPCKIAKEVIAFSSKTKVPTIACFMGEKTFSEAKTLLLQNNIPCFFEAERAVRVLAAAHF